MILQILSVLVIYGIQVFGADYKPVINELSNQITTIERNVRLTRLTVNEYLTQFPSNDVGIRKEKRIDAVQTALNQKAGKPGIEACKKRFEDAVAAALLIAQAIVQESLNNVLKSLDNMSASVNSIKTTITGPAVGDIMKQCDADPKNCKLTGQFATSLSKTANNVSSLMDGLKAAPTLIMDKNLSDKIDNDLVKPVNDCLKPL